MTNDFYTQSILPWAGIIIKICRAYTNTREEFEDYYQEVCLQIWRSRDSFAGNSDWSTWIYRLSLNVCMTNLRKRKREQDKVSALDQPLLTEACDHAFNDEVDALYTAIHQLGDIDRAIILLYLEERSYREIAETVGTSANNIGVRISRIKDRLGTILAGKDSTNG